MQQINFYEKVSLVSLVFGLTLKRVVMMFAILSMAMVLVSWFLNSRLQAMAELDGRLQSVAKSSFSSSKPKANLVEDWVLYSKQPESWLNMTHQLFAALPASIQLTGFEWNRSGAISAKGRASSMSSLESFVAKLKLDGFFKEISYKDVSTNPQASVVDKEIDFQLEGQL